MGFMKWGVKFLPDPNDPRYSIPVGKFDEEFLEFCKVMGSPTWFEGGRQGIFTAWIWIREPRATVEKPKDGEEMGSMELHDEGAGVKFFIPLEVLEPCFNQAMGRAAAVLFNPHTGDELRLKW